MPLPAELADADGEADGAEADGEGLLERLGEVLPDVVALAIADEVGLPDGDG